jgi:hypothetical protein
MDIIIRKNFHNQIDVNARRSINKIMDGVDPDLRRLQGKNLAMIYVNKLCIESRVLFYNPRLLLLISFKDGSSYIAYLGYNLPLIFPTSSHRAGGIKADSCIFYIDPEAFASMFDKEISRFTISDGPYPIGINSRGLIDLDINFVFANPSITPENYEEHMMEKYYGDILKSLSVTKYDPIPIPIPVEDKSEVKSLKDEIFSFFTRKDIPDKKIN